MNATHAIEIPLPDGVYPSDEDLASLEDLCRAIVHSVAGDDRRREGTMRKLESEGWRVNCGVAWFAEARRGEQFEKAYARSRADALDSLCQLTLLDSCSGCP